MNREQLLKNLELPTKRIDAILDTDAYNEIDDQFAIAYMLKSEERINTLGICAAPFFNRRSSGPRDGMERSYGEIIKLLELMGKEELASKVYRGSTEYLPDDNTPVMSDAAEYIVSEARKYSPEDPLYIVAIGAITNVASAILLDREAMVNNTVVVWLGGHATHWDHTREFNMKQDFAGARVLFGCGVPVVQLPCMGVVSEFKTTRWELEAWLKGKNPIANYLAENTISVAESYAAGTAWSRCIWDVTAVAWLLNDNDRFMKSYLMPAPIPQDEGHYSYDPHRHVLRYVYAINRDALFTHLFETILK